MDISKLTAQAGTIRAQILEDAIDSSDDQADQLAYIKDVAEYGCAGGSCHSLIYYSDTHTFYIEHADEIDELLQEYEENMGQHLLATANTHGDLRNFLAWFAYEYEAQKIMDEMNITN